MKPPAALVLADRQNQDLADSVFSAGLTPILRDALEPALHKLRHDRFDLILIDRGHVDVDVLEFALNVRDFDQGTPIVVFGPAHSADEDRALTQSKIAVVMREQPGSETFVRRLRRIAQGGGSSTRANKPFSSHQPKDQET